MDNKVISNLQSSLTCGNSVQRFSCTSVDDVRGKIKDVERLYDLNGSRNCDNRNGISTKYIKDDLSCKANNTDENLEIVKANSTAQEVTSRKRKREHQEKNDSDDGIHNCDIKRCVVNKIVEGKFCLRTNSVAITSCSAREPEGSCISTSMQNTASMESQRIASGVCSTDTIHSTDSSVITSNCAKAHFSASGELYNRNCIVEPSATKAQIECSMSTALQAMEGSVLCRVTSRENIINKSCNSQNSEHRCSGQTNSNKDCDNGNSDVNNVLCENIDCHNNSDERINAALSLISLGSSASIPLSGDPLRSVYLETNHRTTPPSLQRSSLCNSSVSNRSQASPRDLTAQCHTEVKNGSMERASEKRSCASDDDDSDATSMDHEGLADKKASEVFRVRKCSTRSCCDGGSTLSGECDPWSRTDGELFHWPGVPAILEAYERHRRSKYTII